MQINYAGKITKDDFLQAIFLNTPQLKLQRWIVSILLAVMVASVLFILNKNPELFSSLFPSLVVLIAGGTYPWWIPYLQLSSFDQKGNIYRNDVFGVINDTEITINNAEIKASFKWSTFVEHRMSKDLLLLYQGKNRFNIFKQSMFSSSDEWEKFVSLTKEKVLVNKNRT